MALTAHIKVDNPGQVEHNDRVRAEVTEPAVHIVSEAGDLGPLLFGHDLAHGVTTGLKDEGIVRTAEGGAIEKARGKIFSPHANSNAGPTVANVKAINGMSSVGVKDFSDKVRSDVTKLGSLVKSRLPKRA